MSGPGKLLSLLLGLLLPSLACSQQVVILQYHHVSITTPASTSLSPALFARHMHYLKDNGYTVLRLEDALAAIRNGRPVPDKAVSITFDDAYRNVYTEAFPLLRELDFPFTIFISAGLVSEKPGVYASWEQLNEMGQAGATLANHTLTHPYLLMRAAGEDEDRWLARVRHEIVAAEEMILTRTGKSQHLLAYPYGEYNLAIQALVKELGYIGLGQQSGAVNITSDFAALPRFPFSGTYASMKTFPVRAGSLAFNIESVIPPDRITHSGNPEATLVLGPGDYRAEQVSCFHMNQPMQLTFEGNSITMTSTVKSSSRRFRYNCTAPAKDGRFYWYSIDWVNPSIAE
jgi:peptidoglycan/xylan/chitin deacetylase (PgdA/CDA1 family)